MQDGYNFQINIQVKRKKISDFGSLESTFNFIKSSSEFQRLQHTSSSFPEGFFLPLTAFEEENWFPITCLVLRTTPFLKIYLNSSFENLSYRSCSETTFYCKITPILPLSREIKACLVNIKNMFWQ